MTNKQRKSWFFLVTTLALWQTMGAADDCDPQDASTCSGDLTCILRLGRHQCDCPFGSGRRNASDTCIAVNEFRLSIAIEEFAGETFEPAMFNDFPDDPNSTLFMNFLRQAIENEFNDGEGGFLSARVQKISRSGRSIRAVPIVSFNKDSNTTLEMVQGALMGAISSKNMLSRSNMKVDPSLTSAQELVCENGYCRNGGTCTPSIEDYSSNCTCVAGYEGSRCEVSRGESIAVILIPLGYALLVTIFAVSVCYCLGVIATARQRKPTSNDRHCWDRTSEDSIDYVNDPQYPMKSGLNLPNRHGGIPLGTAEKVIGTKAEELM
ncbi:uncharacterized protein LOC110975379 isoform X2 [Acanthaster planci]|nr:uncharacterized protein LOC110975379 isoform X2 [Acanthaster planci]